MNIAFLAHDKKKELMVQFCTAYKSVLAKHNLFATATTGRLIADNTGLPVTLLLAWDDAQMLETIRHCDRHNVPFASNLGSAEMFIMGLQRGDLDWRELYHNKSKF